ncbi:hypothetical protein LY624_21115 [Pseudoalteromonas sp. N1230-9]|uniref:hypothetical protein n=1 Tax=unclassified Pseudoalteromonas TaxID=194690 RepID=UPI001022D4F9|nr:hypothetical protein EXT42_20170 [Pseudoalteromonas sp. CO302Y]RZG06552.1 hypothetical protein EXT40_20175 [Pseudoalteromonas sp. CO133X]WOC28369.1 hypothetical protein LY624_21115 [Pseudoalteromonas sp. N1230-9]
MNCRKITLLFSLLIPFSDALAEQKEVQDMSDPLAVYTQVGAGATNKGINLKVGQAYDTGVETTAGMNNIEVKGIYGDALGWESDHVTTDSIDSFRFRNFSVDLTTMSATQIDANYNLNANLVADESMDLSYSYIKALKPVGRFTFYPLAGLGTSLGENTLEDDGTRDSGYSIMGAYGLVGMYAKVTITDKIWLNYNPFWLTTIGGSDTYKDHYYGYDQSHILTHEFAASYQINPRMNLRYFANWNENVDFMDGDHRIEFNYQL